MLSCSDNILLQRRDQHQRRMESGGCPERPRAPVVSGGGTHCSNSVHWGGASRGAYGVSPGSSVLDKDVPSMASSGADVGPLERFEQCSTVGEFGSAGWSFGSAPGREAFAGKTGGGHTSDVAGPSELAPDNVGLNGVDSSVGEGGGAGDLVVPGVPPGCFGDCAGAAVVKGLKADPPYPGIPISSLHTSPNLLTSTWIFSLGSSC